MLEEFIKWKPTYDSQERLRRIGEILAQYEKLGIRLTLRQLYYQLVSKNVVRNHQREYKRLGELLSNARMGGRLDWDIIEDRVRFPQRAGEWSSIESVVYGAIGGFRLPRWGGQPNYVELWCEKDALSSVLAPIADDLHVVLMVNRGYSSTTAMYDAGKRILYHGQGRPVKILYLGDFDPSGEDMVRDIGERLRTFAWPRNQQKAVDIEVRKLALTLDQVNGFNLPPNPAKITDSRAAGFIAKNGESSYEVDALPPDVLMKLVRASIEELMDMKLYEGVKRAENLERERVRAALVPKPAPTPKPCARKCCRKKKPARRKR